MPNEITNPGPWEYWPASGHVVDAAGNTVCTIAPDCGEVAKAIIGKAPEMLAALNTAQSLGQYLIDDSNGDVTEEEAFLLVEDCKEAAALLNHLKTLEP